MRDRDFEEGILNPFKFGMEEEKPVRYLLFVGHEFDKIGGAEHWEDAYDDLYLCAKEGERQWINMDADWFNVFDIEELRVITQAECAKLISDREHKEAQDRVRAYKGK